MLAAFASLISKFAEKSSNQIPKWKFGKITVKDHDNACFYGIAGMQPAS